MADEQGAVVTAGPDPWLKAAALNAAEVQQSGAGAGDRATTPTSAVAKALTPVNVYRFFNRSSAAHFYTASAAERDRVIATLPSMAYEGLAFQASSTADSGLSPVYRFFNGQTGVHFYTISQAERDHIVATLPQFAYEGVAYHASTAAGTGFRPLYRFYVASRGFHFFTTSSAEAGQVIATLPQYRYEGIAYYVLGDAEPAPPSGVGYYGSPVPVPQDGRAVDTSQPDRLIGTGTPASCTGEAVVQAVALGGKIRFSCGPNPVTITLPRTAKVFNDRPDVTLDGGGLVTLSGGDSVRILYQNTCDPAQVWTSAQCQNQETPRLTVQNIGFTQGNSTGQLTDGGGGGAIFVRGGQFKIVNSVFTRNRCETTGPDIGGGAVRVLSIYQDRPVYVVGSTFGGGLGLGNSCSNGGALSSIGVSYSVYNSLITHNTAVGNGANPARAGTPGGGSGGAIYNDGNFFTLSVYGSMVSDNVGIEGGSAVFYVSNDLSGLMTLSDSVFVRNPATRFGTAGLPGFFVLAAAGQPVVIRTSLSN
ncbi:hypothetical protein [Hydrogenophaga sp. MI9]|uniref:hypothetical protein n=1 Tax=Hydrogenophaga sp. MI9 TaxID=3453719 RepID=UPI003EEF3867